MSNDKNKPAPVRDRVAEILLDRLEKAVIRCDRLTQDLAKKDAHYEAALARERLLRGGLETIKVVIKTSGANTKNEVHVITLIERLANGDSLEGEAPF